MVFDERCADAKSLLMAARRGQTDGRHAVVHQFTSQFAARHIRVADGEVKTVGNGLVEVVVIDDIKTGISKTDGEYIEIIDRREAIAYAIHNGRPGDIIVLAGKGHEDYQEINGKRYPMDERVIIKEILDADALR